MWRQRSSYHIYFWNRRKEQKTLSNWSQGLSSSQPDLLSHTSLEFSAAPSSTPTASSRPLVGTTSSQTNVLDRLKENKLRLKELTNKLSELSRSKQDLLDIGKDNDSSVLTLDSSSIHACDGDLDDTAPSIPTARLPSSSYATSMSWSEPVTSSIFPKTCEGSLSPCVDTSPGRILWLLTSDTINHDSYQCAGALISAAQANDWSVADAKTKLEDLRLRLAEKCAVLERRKREIDQRVLLSQADRVLESGSYARAVNVSVSSQQLKKSGEMIYKVESGFEHCPKPEVLQHFPAILATLE